MEFAGVVLRPSMINEPESLQDSVDLQKRTFDKRYWAAGCAPQHKNRA
jgi:hypothetical protein